MDQYQQCADWIQNERCNCIRKKHELKTKQDQVILTIPKIDLKIVQLNQALLRVKESLVQSEQSLKELSSVTGTQYKMNILPEVESEVHRQLQDLNDKRNAARKEVQDLSREMNKVCQECREACLNRANEAVREFVSSEESSANRETSEIMHTGTREKYDCTERKDREVSELKRLFDQKREKLNQDYEQEVKNCEAVIQDYLSGTTNPNDSVVMDIRKRIDTLTEEYRKETQELKDRYEKSERDILNKFESRITRIHKEVNSKLNEIQKRGRDKTEQFIEKVRGLIE